MILYEAFFLIVVLVCVFIFFYAVIWGLIDLIEYELEKKVEK